MLIRLLSFIVRLGHEDLNKESEDEDVDEASQAATDAIKHFKEAMK